MEYGGGGDQKYKFIHFYVSVCHDIWFEYPLDLSEDNRGVLGLVHQPKRIFTTPKLDL